MRKTAKPGLFWDYDKDDEYRLSFKVRHADGSEETLLSFRTFEQEKFLSVAVFIGEREHLWPQWRAAVEREGSAALDEILNALWTTDYIPNFIDVNIVEDPLKAKTATMSVLMQPQREVEVIRHRFRTAKQHRAFFGWVGRADIGRRTGLCLIGLLEGRIALAAMMDAIAQAELEFGKDVMRAMIAAFEDGSGEAFIPARKLI